MTAIQAAKVRFVSPVALVVVAIGHGAAVADWPSFGGAKADENVEPTSAETAAEGEPMIDSPAFKIGWPKVEMPKFSWKPGFLGDGEKSGKGSSENPISQTLDKVSDASKRAADGVRDAWGSAVSKLSFGDDRASQTAGAEKQGWLSRLFGPAESAPQGAQTVQEFLAQDRPGTTRR